MKRKKSRKKINRKKQKRRRMVESKEKEEELVEFFILNIKMIDSKIALIGKDVSGKRIVWIVADFHPYFYFTSESETNDSETIEQNFYQIYRGFLLNFGIKIYRIDSIMAKPFFGYQSKFDTLLKVCLGCEEDRIKFVNMLRIHKLPNAFEMTITTLERFLVDTNIKIGKWIKLPKSNPNGMKKINEHYVVFYKCLEKTLRDKKRYDFRPGLCHYSVLSFKIFQSTPEGERVYPISHVTENLKKERFDNSISKTHPITTISFLVHYYEGSTLVRTKRLVFSRSVVERMNNVEIIQSKSELEVIIASINLIRNVDIVVGFKLMDPYYANSIQYILNRLRFLGRKRILIDNVNLKDVENLVKPKSIYNRECRNPFEFTILLDVFNYANRRDHKNIKNDCFENVYIHFTGNEINSDRSFHEISNHLRCRMTKSEFRKEMQSDEKTNIFEEALESCTYKLELFQTQHMLETMITRSVWWGLDMNDVWFPGSSKIFRFCMLHTLSEMKRDNIYYVIYSSKNSFHTRRRPDDHYLYLEDHSQGGEILKPKYGFVDNNIIGVDSSNHYPTSIISKKFDYVNMVSLNEECACPVDNLQTLICKVGLATIAFIQMNSDELPLSRLLIKLRRERNIAKEKIKNCSQEEEIARLKITESVIKRSMVSFTGCLSSTFGFIFRNHVIGQVMRYWGRQTFNFARKMIDNKKFEISFGKKEKIILKTEVVAGHTDGFDVSCSEVKKKKSGEEKKHDFNYDNLMKVGQFLCSNINNGLKTFMAMDFKYVNYSCSYDEPIQFKIDYILKKAIYHNPNNKIVMNYDGSIKPTGSFCNLLSNSELCRNTYLKAVKDIFSGKSSFLPQHYIDSYIHPKLDQLNPKSDEDRIFEIIDKLTKYERATEKMHRAKFDNSERFRVSKILSHFQKKKDCEYEIPAINQIVPYIWIKMPLQKNDCSFPLPPDFFSVTKHKIDKSKYSDHMKKAIEELLSRIKKVNV